MYCNTFLVLTIVMVEVAISCHQSISVHGSYLAHFDLHIFFLTTGRDSATESLL